MDETHITIRLATEHMFLRYRNMLCDSDFLVGPSTKEHLIELIDIAVSKGNTFPTDKLNRWLGFVQAIVIFNNLTSVQEERDYSRPWFHAAYQNEGIDIPETIDLT